MINLFAKASRENSAVVEIFLAETLRTLQGTSRFRKTNFGKRISKEVFKRIVVTLLRTGTKKRISKEVFKRIVVTLLRTGTKKRRVQFWGLIQPL
jgi:hypothetical protein